MTEPQLALEDLLHQILATYTVKNTLPHGSVLEGPTQSNNVSTLAVHAFGKPMNFHDFFVSGRHSMSKEKAYEWYSRLVLRYSCSTLTTMFQRAIAPELGKYECLFSKALGRSVNIRDMSIMHVYFVPKTPFHDVRLDYGILLPPRTERVEPLMDGYCPHNILFNNKDGTIIDIAMGQFTGRMSPYVFPDMDSFKAEFTESVGDIASISEVDEVDIETQMTRDGLSYNGHKANHNGPPYPFARSIIDSFLNGANKSHCWNCKGSPGRRTNTKLTRCSRCKKALFCGKECQLLMWPSHKPECQAS